MDKICELADPIRLALKLHGKGLIAEGTKDQVNQVTGMDNYQKNASLLNEVEKVIKYDSDKLVDFCEILQAIPTLKRFGDEILQSK